MVPLVTELGLAALITAAGSSIAALIGSLVQGMKTRAEVEQMRGHVTAAMETTQHELTHNHGSSMKDASTRTEGKVDRLSDAVEANTELTRGVVAEQDRQATRLHALETGLGGIRDDVRQIHRSSDSEHGTLRDDISQIRDDVRAIQGRCRPRDSPACGGWDYRDHETSGQPPIFRAPGRDDDIQEDT
ncbi:hypothetical protein PACID_15340 [Acidipropionibacterium acidipropionici ATCC 4875]|uniref:DUF2746 domain-containing protein n=1 Tax=Acidipropionibacterium acidipropionici (strain ATCC 4875 / DSM 20272 / JCM 6432 / NBRC 12425 / NCIMB 8070 / 4) TaxID=1171373 RepID=K7S458_ACIA4|nr:hypothetical protein [Acidipropionibacterium acidipropionici]AFV89347.1 hypothetical protein PACID_15340 [Acidipropionibacterium acidipropionici ATCC 4875]